MELLLAALEREEKNLNGYFIDGYPRTVEQLDQFKQKVTNLLAFLTWLVKNERLRTKQRGHTLQKKDTTGMSAYLDDLLKISWAWDMPTSLLCCRRGCLSHFDLLF